MAISQANQCPNCLPGPGKPSPMMWELVPLEVKSVLLDEGSIMLTHWARRQHHAYVRFQYAPLTYKGDLFYLQRWSATEWHVSQSQLIFPHEGWPCTEHTRRHAGKLSLLVRRAIAELIPDAQPSFSNVPQSSLVSVS